MTETYNNFASLKTKREREKERERERDREREREREKGERREWRRGGTNEWCYQQALVCIH